MSHYAIVKRQNYIANPKWIEALTLSNNGYHFIKPISKSFSLVKYEDMDIDSFSVKYKNSIIDEYNKGSLVTYWSGRIDLLPLELGESLIINEENFTIKKVDKDVNGTVTYLVDDLIVKDENYDALLYECEKAYTAYSELLHHQKEELQESIDDEGNDDYQKGLVKNKPWWIRLFK